MPYPPRPISPALVTEARRLYEETNVPVRDIASLVGLGERTLYARIHKWGWRMRCDRVPNAELDKAATIASVQSAPTQMPEQPEAQDMQNKIADEAGLAERLQRAVERELAAVETLIAKLGDTAGRDTDAERSARTLAMLSRVLRELARLQRDEKEEARDESQDEFHDLDEFRRELAERLDRLRRQRESE